MAASKLLSTTFFSFSTCILLILIALVAQSKCFRPLHGETGLLSPKKATNGGPSSKGMDYKTYYIELPVDHFGFANQDTFKLRYLVAKQFWDEGKGPVFFYAGNEGDITLFLKNTGFMWDIAPEFKAMIIFAEHRYYGTSLPYGNKSYSDPKHLGYLTSEQALADFASLIAHLKTSTPGLDKVPFIAFGGSYGGMLASWMRMKYPHYIQGALAASAPIWYFGDLTPCDSFSRISTDDFTRESPACSSNIRKSWSVIRDMGKSEAGRQTLSSVFRLCKPVKTGADVNALAAWLSGSYGNMAMVDYPYPANFLEPLPAWPIKVACTHLSDGSLSGKALLEGVAKVMGVYYNYTGNHQCYNTSQQASSSLDDQGWYFQACTEMVMPMCSNGVTDMFEPAPWNFTAFKLGCQKVWGVTPNPQAALIEYGGKKIKTASNIIFSNGKLDPWGGAGVLDSLSESLVAIVIDEAAHHLDLRSSNPGDPASVIAARKQEKAIIKSWIKQYQLQREEEELVHHKGARTTALGLSLSGHMLVGFSLILFVIFMVFLLVKVIRPHSSYLVLSQPRAAPSWFNATVQDKKQAATLEKRPLLA